MRRFVIAAAVLGGVLVVLGGGGLAWLRTSRSGVEFDVKPRPPEAPDRRVTRFGPGDPRQGSAPVYPSGQLPPPSAPVPSARELAADPGVGADVDPTPGDTDPPVAVHAVDKDGLTAAVRSQMPEIRDCYQTLLASYPGVGGRVVVAFSIRDGRVQAADVGEVDFDSVYLEGCLVTAMEDLRFEPGFEGDVTWPFVFAPE